MTATRTRLLVQALERREVPAVFIVDNPSEIPVTNQLTFAQAIASANATVGADTIAFNLPVNGGAVAPLQLLTALPVVTSRSFR